MKRFISIWAAIAMIFSFYACDGNKNYTPRNSDTEINRPDDNEGDSDDTGDTGDSGDTEGTIDRSQYMQYNHTLTKGQAGYYGVYYEDQPTTTANWYLELADNNYDFETYEGNGFNTVLEFFSSNPSSTSIPVGEYTIEAFDSNPFSAGSLLYGYLGEYDENGETVEYPAGTWLFEGDEAIAGATAGNLTVAKSGSNYTINYVLHDDEYQITFKGTFSGSLTIYDGTESASYVSAAKATKAHRADKQVKRYRVRR